jgi:aldehyde:ferredoxin oxidoreductase
MSGTFIPANSKLCITTKSPATLGYGDSNIGGHLAAEIRYAGYDSIVIRGKAEKPTVILIDDENVDFLDATDLWGKGSTEAERLLKDKLGDDWQIAIIGPAGENLVHFACISHDFGRQAGRCGIGAVLGSKNVKAVAVRGSHTIPVADIEKVHQLGDEMFAHCKAHPTLGDWHKYGLHGMVSRWSNSIGTFPTRNFQTTFFEGEAAYDKSIFYENNFIHTKACQACPMACGKYSKAKTKKYDTVVEGPEYETTALIGGCCAMPTVDDVIHANYVCDELGIDTISGGVVIAFAIECFEKGVITEEMIGRKISFGSIEDFEYLARLIAKREGIGAILADGTRAASRKFGKGSSDYAIQVKGLEWSGYDSRSSPASMLAYCTSDTGAHHSRAWAVTHDITVGREILEGKAQVVIDLQHVRPVFDTLGLCRLLWVEIGLSLDFYPPIVNAVLGKDYTMESLCAISERIWNLTRMFWVREVEGFGRKDDYPPARFLNEKIPTGPAQGSVIPRETLDKLLDDYYSLRGWDQNGIPKKETLEKFGLAEKVEA